MQPLGTALMATMLTLGRVLRGTEVVKPGDGINCSDDVMLLMYM
jgi:hypothetical protein